MNTAIDSKSKELRELELLEGFLCESSKQEIIQSANYVFNRAYSSIGKLRGTPEQYLTSRYVSIVNSLQMFLENQNKCIIFVADRRRMGGFADAMRGLCNLYHIAKSLNVDFFVDWTCPSDLTNYLIPNKYNWLLQGNEKRYDESEKTIIDFRSNLNLDTSLTDKVSTLLKEFNCVSVRTEDHRREKNYGANFDELFKPTDYLQSLIDLHLSALGTEYISVHLRFGNLLGDFNDTKDLPPALSTEEQASLIGRCKDRILQIHQENQNSKIFVASDSKKFIDTVAPLNFVYTTPGEIVHSSYDRNKSVEDHTKTFLEYYLLTYSKRIYSVLEGQMYNGGFARRAALHRKIEFIQ